MCRGHKKDYGTRSWSVSYLNLIAFHEFHLTSFTAISQGNFQVWGKLRLRSHIVMQIVSQEFGTAMSTMTIENGEELNLEFRLLGAIGLNARLLKVKHDRYSILIIVSDQSIMCVSTIWNHVRRKRLLSYLGFLYDWTIGDCPLILCSQQIRVKLWTLHSHGWKHLGQCLSLFTSWILIRFKLRLEIRITLAAASFWWTSFNSGVPGCRKRILWAHLIGLSLVSLMTHGAVFNLNLRLVYTLSFFRFICIWIYGWTHECRIFCTAWLGHLIFRFLYRVQERVLLFMKTLRWFGHLTLIIIGAGQHISSYLHWTAHTITILRYPILCTLDIESAIRTFVLVLVDGLENPVTISQVSRHILTHA